MNSSQDTEITLGTAKLLGLFFGLVMVCAVFFALGYTLGRKSDAGLNTASAAAPLPTTTKGPKPPGSAAEPAAPMTFYKAVEQKDASAQLTPAASTETAPASASTAAPAPAATEPTAPLGTLPTSAYFVQVAAVSKQDDAQALVGALREKQYPAFVVNSGNDKLFHVQVGPFSDIKDAEGMRSRLINDGYSPILKK
jgi:DedD protein